MAVQIGGKRLWLWRAVDSEGEVLDLLVQRWRDKAAAMKLMRKLLKKQGLFRAEAAEQWVAATRPPEMANPLLCHESVGLA